MSKVKCESRVDAGATRIRGWHDYTDCGLTAKYKITYNDGTLVNPEYFFDKSPIEACVKAIGWLTERGYTLNVIEKGGEKHGED